MTPQTRSSKKNDTDSKIYRSKKVPQQAYFPHKRRTVRRPSPPTPKGSDKRQMIFLPEKMRENSTTGVKDSDDDGEDEDMEEQNTIEVAKRMTKKRGQATMQDEDEDEEDNESVGPTRNRKRKDVTQRRKRQRKQIKAEPTNEQNNKLSDLEDPTPSRLVRQSTMTQLVEGRQAVVDDEAEEPRFRPVKRSPRLSWGGKRREKAMDKKQRTLTQMVPRMQPIGVMSDDDMEEALGDLEAEDENSQEYDNMVAQRLARQGLHRVESHARNETFGKSFTKKSVQSFMSGGDDENGQDNTMGRDEDHSYQPTQYIDAPTTRTRASSQRQANTHNTRSHVAKSQTPSSSKSRMPRFSSLSTPEKQRVHEIPSSQSPAESPLFTQTLSPYRSPLKERSGNTANKLQTPSKLKKVSFQETGNDRSVAPTLKKFCSTIQDSEDEDEDSIEGSLSPSRRRIDGQMQSPPSVGEAHLHGKDVGAETQAMLERIEQACAHVDQGVSPSETETQQQLPGGCDTSKQQSYLAAHIDVKREPSNKECLADISSMDTASLSEGHQSVTQVPVEDEAGLMQPLEAFHSTPPPHEVFPQDTLPSTPMVLQDESSDEHGDELSPTPSCKTKDSLLQPTPIGVQQSADLGSEIIQCPRSPSPHHETQQSHSSRAEQQLQNEWFSYSQYVNARSPQSSSMHATHDPFSHVATPGPVHENTHSPEPSEHQRSQATTVDEVTPKKDRMQRIVSANVTPRRAMKSRSSLISPSKLPPLYIPSSFPDPTQAGMEGWSSPALQETQLGVGYAGNLSWEEFSIPLPPPPGEGEES